MTSSNTRATVAETRSAGARFALTPHAAVFLTFLAFGVGMGLWTGASAALLARTGVDPATFGITLTVYTCFYLFAMSGASTLAKRAGVKRVVIGSAVAVAPALAIVLTAGGPIALIVGLLLYALAAGVLDASMNAQGASLERRLGRPIMARLHGGASSGGAIGAILGSVIVSGASPALAAVLETVVFLGAAAIVAFAAVGDRDDRLGGGAELKAKVLTRSLVVIGVVVGVSIACETAALAWSAPLLRAEAPRLIAYSGLGGAFFSACQAALRLNADKLRARFDDRTVIAISLMLAAIGLLVVAMPFGFAVSAIGFAIVGVGTGCIVPCGFALAAARPGVSTAAAISAVAFFGLFARVPSPLVTGFIAQTFSLSAAFLAIAALLVCALAAVLIFIPSNQSGVQT